MKIKYVNRPKKPDGKFGNIKSDDGETYFVSVGCLGKYQVGMEIDPPFDNKKWGVDVVKVIPPHYDPSANNNAPEPQSQPQPQQQRPAGNGARMSNADSKDALIFVTGVVGRAMGSGKFAADAVGLLTQEAIKAWREQASKL